MQRLTWWFRVVGGFYVLVAVINLYFVFVNPRFYATILPVAATLPVLQAFTDAWLVFVLEFLGIGMFLLWASRKPLDHRNMVWLIVVIEALRGVLADVIWIARGFSAASYLPWVGLHVLIIATGILCVRRAPASADGTARTAVTLNRDLGSV